MIRYRLNCDKKHVFEAWFANSKASAFLAGSGLRMFVVLVATLVLQEFRADLGLKEFLSWLVAFYSMTLLVETLLIVKSPDANTVGKSATSPL